MPNGEEKGFTLIELMIVIAIIAIIAAIAIPNLIEARKGANESAAIGALRTMTSAQTLFREGDKDHNNTLDYASTVLMLGQANLVDPVLSNGTKQGYIFSMIAGNIFAWSCSASPQTANKTGDRYFFVDESGVIRYSSVGVSNNTDTPIGQ